MTEPVDFDAKRKAKQKRCQICGGPVHDYLGQCRRIAAITQEEDGSDTYHLYPLPDEPPLAG